MNAPKHDDFNVSGVRFRDYMRDFFIYLADYRMGHEDASTFEAEMWWRVGTEPAEAARHHANRQFGLLRDLISGQNDEMATRLKT